MVQLFTISLGRKENDCAVLVGISRIDSSDCREGGLGLDFRRRGIAHSVTPGRQANDIGSIQSHSELENLM